MSGWNWRKWVLMALLLAGVFLAQHAGPQGLFPVAEGCSGYGSLGGPPGWRYFVVASKSEQERVEVGTDGFVLLEATFTGHDEEGEPAEIEVTASDQVGPVAGRLELLRSVTRPGRPVVNYWGWQADEPLPVGSIVQLSFGISNGLWPISDTVELEVVGEPAALPTPSAALGEWVDYRRGAGELVECTIDLDFGSCGDPEAETILVPEGEVRHWANDTLWQVPEIQGMVAWAAHAELSGPLDDAVTVEDEVVVVGGVDVGDVDAGMVVFPSDAEEYCVVLVVEDLRTGEEVRSEPVCGDPEQAIGSGVPIFAPRLFHDHRLDQCTQPPTAASKDLWCAYHPEDPPCVPGPDSGGTGPSEAGQASVGDAGETGVGGRTSSGEPTPRARSARDSESCRFRPAPAGVATHALALLFALGLVLGRRLGARHGRR
jgi:hypothetical protein